MLYELSYRQASKYKKRTSAFFVTEQDLFNFWSVIKRHQLTDGTAPIDIQVWEIDCGMSIKIDMSKGLPLQPMLN